MKCYKDLKRECNVRYCKDTCYIKDKQKNLVNVFNSDNPNDRQKQVNNYMVDLFKQVINETFDVCFELTYEKFKMYPNFQAVYIVRKKINELQQL